MISYIWPIMLVVASNTIYQICAKSVPETINPHASLTLTYLVATFVSALLFFLLNDEANLWKEYSKTNWASLILGIVVVGLETG